MAESRPVPLVYKLWFQLIEPLFAINGVVLAVFYPQTFLRSIPLPSGFDLSKATAANDPLTTSLLFQLSGLFAFFALVEVTVTRAATDFRVWQCVAFASGFSDVIHLAGAHRMMGKTRFWNPLSWTGDEWATLAIFWVGLVTKTCLCFGLGVGRTAKRH